MAFVGISQGLRQEVHNRIRNMRYAELQTLGSDPADTLKFTGNEPWIFERMWQGKQHLLNELPQSWLPDVERVTVRVKLNWDGTYRGNRINDSEISINLQKGMKVAFPPYLTGTHYPDVYIGFKPDEELPVELLAAIEFRKKHKEVCDRWDKVDHQVETFLNSCKSLNEGLKLWPSLSVYIPKHYLERVEKKADRSEGVKSDAAKALEQINTDELQAAAVIARMSGAEV